MSAHNLPRHYPCCLHRHPSTASVPVLIPSHIDPVLVDPPDDPCGVSGDDGEGGNILLPVSPISFLYMVTLIKIYPSDHRSSAHNGTFADGDAPENDHVPAEPAVFLDDDSLRHFGTAGAVAFTRVDGMRGGVDGDVGGEDSSRFNLDLFIISTCIMKYHVGRHT